jgi:hypothetical protein
MIALIVPRLPAAALPPNTTITLSLFSLILEMARLNLELAQFFLSLPLHFGRSLPVFRHLPLFSHQLLERRPNRPRL